MKLLRPPSDYLRYGINLADKLWNRLMVKVRTSMLPSSQKAQPNAPDGWEKMYLTPVMPVQQLKSEIASIIRDLTFEHETLLETGCGSGRISAELACAKRKAAVCDFSQPILDRVKCLFAVSNLAAPETYLVDLTQKLPFDDDAFDVIWNSGVLEHWTDQELTAIVSELSRCAKRCVISLVPNERSVFYRYGRESAEMHGIAPWGREIPRSSLRSIFEQAGLVNVTEKSVCVSDAPNLISIIDPVFADKVKMWWNALPDDDPVKESQGYLLLTIGYKTKC